MKRLFFLLLVFLTISAAAQTKKDTTAAIKTPADSVEFVSARHFEEFAKLLPTLSHAEYVQLTPEGVVYLFYRWSVTQWNNRQKKQK